MPDPIQVRSRIVKVQMIVAVAERAKQRRINLAEAVPLANVVQLEPAACSACEQEVHLGYADDASL